jgi:hypothetical protein
MHEAMEFDANAADRIGALAKKCQQIPDEKLRQARATMKQIAVPAEMSRLEPRLEELRTAIEDAESDPQCHEAVLGRVAAEAPAFLAGLERLRVYTLGAVVACAVLVSIVAAFAVATIALSAYEPNHTFSSARDYFLLFSAALGSGAAASILAVAGWWQATADESS